MTKAEKKEKKENTLYAAALKLARENSVETLHTATSLPISWLHKFRAGQIRNPSVNRVEIFVTRLTGKNITIS